MEEKQKTFGFRKQITYKKKFFQKMNLHKISFFYLFFMLFFYIVFNFLNNIVGFVKTVDAKERIGLLDSKFQEVAVCSRFINKDFSNFLLSVDKIWKDYKNWKNIFDENMWNINYSFEYIQNHSEFINYLWINQYKSFLDFIGEMANHKKDIYSLLGKNQKQSYIIALENSGEFRPNWGFFGSFILLTLDGAHWDYEIMDSYKVRYDGREKEVSVDSPEWMKENLWKEKIGFVASNVFGFTEKDWKNIQKIFQKTYPESNIRWVFFVKSSLLEKMFPDLREKIYKRQFVNASIDIIRWKDKSNKKEFYIKELKEYLASKKGKIAKRLMQNFDKILKEKYIQIYLDDISSDMNQFIKNNNLSTNYKKNNIYFWDFNRAYNKMDRFVDKYIQIYSLKWESKKFIAEYNKDFVDISEFSKWKYLFRVIYSVSVPQRYEKYINRLENQYKIELWEREEHILWLNYKFKNKWLIYFPKNFELISVKKDWNFQDSFLTDFSKGLTYKVSSEKNNTLNIVDIVFEF